MERSLEDEIAEIYEGAASGQFFDLLPDLIARSAGARSCVVQKTDSSRTPIGIAYSWFTPEMVETYVDEEIFLDDVWANCAAEHGLYDQTIDIGEFTGPKRYLHSRFYQDFVRRFGDDTGQCIGALLRRPDGGFLTFGAHRAAKEASFSRDEARFLNRLNPHFLRAAAIDDKLGLGSREAGHMRAALDEVAKPLLTISPSHKVVLVNMAAEKIIARADGLVLAAGRLTAVQPACRQRLDHAVATALAHAGDQGGSVLIERGSGKRPYVLMIAPLQVDGVTHAMIMLDDPDRELGDLPRRMRDLYGLTQAETEVALLVAKGHSAEEIAVRRGVGVNTIKTLLHRCFRKTDTHRATQLAQTVNRLAV